VTGTQGPEVPSVLESDDFIRDSVWRRLDAGTEPPAVELVRYRAGVVEYRFDNHRSVVAKPFDDAAKGAAAYAIQRALWEGGFGAGANYRVPEPIAYLPDQRVVLMGVALGQRLRELAMGDREAWHEGLRGAARWLAALHASSHRLGPTEDSTRLALHMARRVAQTAARRPGVEQTLVGLLDELAARSPPPGRATPEVQTHGRYAPLHVYVASDCISVIDTDRAAPGDPAKDVGEFLHRLRDNLMMARLEELADPASSAFLDEYARKSAADLTRLAFYWSYSVLFTIVVRTRKTSVDDADELDRRKFYEAEFAAIPRRVAEYALAPRGEL
jgi:phosphotransferase family enzyme